MFVMSAAGGLGPSSGAGVARVLPSLRQSCSISTVQTGPSLAAPGLAPCADDSPARLVASEPKASVGILTRTSRH